MSLPMLKALAVLKQDINALVEVQAHAHAVILESFLDEIDTIKCIECLGIGHSKRICGTYAKVQKFTKGN